MPALSMTLADACSILTGLKTFHFPSGNLWNDAQGALPVWAIADDIPNAIAQATTIEWTGCLIMAALRRQRPMLRVGSKNRKAQYYGQL